MSEWSGQTPADGDRDLAFVAAADHHAIPSVGRRGDLGEGEFLGVDIDDDWYGRELAV